ncbi:MAG: hypothetical protein RLZ98_1268 [Pseudomonadota bacterium]|jgi:predicted chitinase/peptidoglycan hydrolase-like protein with peptidoglycan-binding domain
MANDGNEKGFGPDLPPVRGKLLPAHEEATRDAVGPAHDDELDGPEDLPLFDEEESVTRSGIPRVAWPSSDAEAPDYAHLEPGGREPKIGDEDFVLTAAELDLVIRANQYLPEGFDDQFVFAIRGARLKNGDSAEGVTSIALNETRPDHREFMCTIGFYSPKSGHLSAFKASTVPNVQFMTNYYRKMNRISPFSSTNANMLPTGCYVYRVNAHKSGTIKPALRLTSPDRLTEDGTVTTLRTHNDLTFRDDDLWDRCVPYDNVHCAYKFDSFSSAGCLTICGPNGQGPWGKFQAVLKTMRWNARQDVVLMTGREATIAAYIIQANKHNDPDIVRRYLGRLRHGSQGPAVKRLQAKLGFEPTGYFGASTKLTLTQLQKEKGLRPDGIYSDAVDQALGWDVMQGWSLKGGAGEPEPAPVAVPAAVTAPEPAEVPAPPGGEAPAQPDAGTATATAATGAGAGAATVATQPAPVPQPEPVSQPRNLAGVPGGPEAATNEAVVPPHAPVPTPPAPSIITRPKLAFTPETLRRFASKAQPRYVEAFLDYQQMLGEYGVNEHPMRFCHFLGQIGNECGRLRILEENMNYTTAARLQAVWPSRFPTRASAEPFVRNPEKLANNVYGGRLGNTEPGDGWRYRGRGFVQITGRGSYREMGKKLNIDLENNPDLAFDPRFALAIACETWKAKQLAGERSMNDLAEANKLEAMTYRVNGGYTNLDDRRAAFEEAWAIWAEDRAPKGPLGKGMLDRGDRGLEVRTLNDHLARLGMFDGITRRKPGSVFNFYTYKAVRAFNEREGDKDPIGFVASDTVERIENALSRTTRSRSAATRSPEALPRSADTISDRIRSRLRIIRTTSLLLAVLALVYAVVQLLAMDGGSALSDLAPVGPFVFAALVFLFAVSLWIAAAPLARAVNVPNAEVRRSISASEEPDTFIDLSEEPVRNGINLDNVS